MVWTYAGEVEILRCYSKFLWFECPLRSDTSNILLACMPGNREMAVGFFSPLSIVVPIRDGVAVDA
jgi:hypothetical protein